MIGADIEIAIEFLLQNQLVAIPTETVYGLAANALSAEAVVRIFEVKNRPFFDPLIVHTGSLAQITQLTEQIPDKAWQLAEKMMPGPITLLLPKKPVIPDLVTSGLPDVAVRIPAHPLTLQLLTTLPFPLAAPSANPFGYVSPTTAQHVQDQLGDKIPYILNGGACTVGIESTIIGFSEPLPTIYRIGGISVEEIMSIIGKVNVQTHSTSNPKAAGMLQSHYAPRKPLILGEIADMLPLYPIEQVGILSFCTDYGAPNQIILSKNGNLAESARNLFAALRQFDTMPVTLILAEPVPNVGLGRAINDRLRRAAAPVSH